ncbi:NAD-dependent succinate-semialdehyde dehydrogenase [Brucella sp. NBRC 12950]|jgi:succinate-semialdehyde dehydrogenase/glutarate-semialdehyde dehydrogenase|uniref:NAD-dependent succinate-semialdehyde dehydrogenase n=1 Tax=Brucella sp. NBRC 12950 TaxID=2994518 RepID=UPI0024A2C50E|nr:NAD-dependent succinate-semialdehyde dehydrogenase [Brucella sp. NBRC 12950]GLU27344.1 NAD-dependent succinate-semialdehyde dehydrogenase [Brucella sp. NBRC 12950]
MTQTMFIDGKWTAGSGSRRFPVVNPATGEKVAEVSLAEIADLDAALEAADRAFVNWARTSAYDRAAILKRAASFARERSEEIAQAITREQGKPLSEARMEAGSAGDHIEWYAEEARRTYGRVIPTRQPEVMQNVILEPVGPVAAFSPWNFPIGQIVRKIAGALAAGCTIIAKAPEETPSCVIALVRCFEDAGVPAGVLNLVFGVPAEISEHLIPSPIIRKVSFTGSVPVGQHLGALAAKHLKRTTMELGGHAPFIVCDDYNVAKAAALGAGLKFRNAGQVCASPTRFLIQEAVFDTFTEAFVGHAKALKLDAGTVEGVGMGPVAHARRLDMMQDLVDDAVSQGAKLLTGGARHGNIGFFFEPTVLADVPPSARIMNEEPFGPIAIVNRFAELDEAIKEANRLPYGLAAFGFSTRNDRTHAMVRGIETGMLSLNHFGLAAPETPFGGIKDSGHGSEGGSEGIQAYLTTKFVSQMNG